MLSRWRVVLSRWRRGSFGEAASATTISLACRVAAAGFSFLLSLLVARQLGAEGSGILALASTTMAIAFTLSLCGLDYTSVRAVAAARAAKDWPGLRAWVRTASTVALVAAGLSTAGLWFFSQQLALMLGGSSALSSAVAVVGLAVVPMTASRLLSSYLRGMRSIVWSSVVDPLLFPAMAVALIALQPIRSVYDVVHVYPLSATIAAAVGLAWWAMAMREVPRKKSGLVIKLALSRSLPIYGSILGGFASPWITTLVIGALGSEAQTGVYRVAYQIALILTFPYEAASTGLAPQLAALHATGNLDSIRRTARRVIMIVFLLGAVPAVVFFVFSNELLSIFGHEFVAGSTALKIMAIGTIMSLAFGPTGMVMAMTGLEQSLFLISLGSAVLVAVLSILLIPSFGATGAAAAATIATFFRLVAQTVMVWRAHGILLPLGITKHSLARMAPLVERQS